MTFNDSFKRRNPETASPPLPNPDKSYRQEQDPSLDTDQGFMPEPELGDESDLQAIQRLSRLSPLEYDRIRKSEAKRLNIRITILDAAVKANSNTKKQTQRLPFDEIQPHLEAISPVLLLDDIKSIFTTYMVMDENEAVFATLWVCMTWFIDAIDTAPLAIVNAPEKSCGKTLLLELFSRLSYRPLPASNATVSALFRAVELWKPTILIDESDTFFLKYPELHGLVNAGYLKGGYVLRCEAIGDTYEPKKFSVYSAKALAGIKLEKHLPDTTMSRGIVFNLRRKLSSEKISRLRHADPAVFKVLAEKLARFGCDYTDQLKVSRPLLSDKLTDREQDNWEPLLAIALLAGDDWFKKATIAAIKLSDLSKERVATTSNELLSDIENVFIDKEITRISTVNLINALCEDDEAPWSTYNKGKPIAPRQLVNQLKFYGIKPRQIDINFVQARGFDLSDLKNTFLRYLASHRPDLSVISVRNGNKTSNDGASGDTDSLTHDTCYVTDSEMSMTDNVTHDTYKSHVSPLQASNAADSDTMTHKNSAGEEIKFITERF